MIPLERRIRALVALFPCAFQQRWEEDLVATMLASRGPHQRWPRIEEVVDLVAAALRAHAAVPEGQSFATVVARGIALGGAVLGSLRMGALVLRFFWFAYWLPDNVRMHVDRAAMALYGGELALELVVYGIIVVAILRGRRALVGVGAMTLGCLGLLHALRYPGPLGTSWALAYVLPAAVPFVVVALAVDGKKRVRDVRLSPALVVLCALVIASAAGGFLRHVVVVTWHLSHVRVEAGLVLGAVAFFVASIRAQFVDPRWFVALAVAAVGWNVRDLAVSGNPGGFVGTGLLVALAAVHWRVLQRRRARLADVSRPSE